MATAIDGDCLNSSLQMIGKFVSFDTTSRGSNLQLIHFVRNQLESHGIACNILPNEMGTKANLVARLGPPGCGGLILSGHTDTVPVEDQVWSHEPFALTRVHDRLFGRGTADMKSFLAICVALAPEFSRMKLREPLYIAMSFDEEVGCLGVPSLIDWFTALEWKPRACIVGEPTGMEVFIAHKGINVFETTVVGREAHSSQTGSGASAIAAAARLISFLDEVGQEMRERGDPTGVFAPDGFTSVNVGEISGGTAFNIIPGTCKFKWEYRHIPGTDGTEIIERFRAYCTDAVLPMLRAVAPETSIGTRTIVQFEGLRPEKGSLAESLALKCAGKIQAGTTAFGTEAGLFQGAGIPTVVCGPGSIAQAHRPDEYISIDQVKQCTAFLRQLAQSLT